MSNQQQPIPLTALYKQYHDTAPQLQGAFNMLYDECIARQKKINDLEGEKQQLSQQIQQLMNELEKTKVPKKGEAHIVQKAK